MFHIDIGRVIMKHTLLSTLLAFGLAFQAHAADLVIDDSVDRQARAWLAHLDDGHVDKAWEAGDPLLKKVLPLEDWLKSMKAVTALGTVQRRALSSVTFTSKMPGSVDGDYALLHYDTAFRNKASTVETVILKRDADQLWRSVGYLVK